MEYLPDNIGELGGDDNRQTVSEWNVWMPANVDRSAYIKNCFLTNTITIVNRNAEVRHKVRIGNLALQQVRFPKDSTDIGSDVICVTAPYSGKLFVVDVFDTYDQYNDQSENQFVFRKFNDSGSASLLIDGPNGLISIALDSDGDGGIFNLNISNQNSTAQLNIIVDGVVNVNSTGAVTILSQVIQLLDGSFGGLTKTEELQSQLNNLNSQLQAVITSLQGWTPAPGDGGAALQVFFDTQITGKEPGDFSDIENSNITHGIPASS